MKLITIYLPEPYLEALDELVNRKLYPHRAEAIRAAIRDLIEVELWGRKSHGKTGR
ncbi:MAG: ribbon-helix-helix domain-containing protein [Candidatus Bathyarchaeia archaeon]|nr:ribbon-helix-helix protein, CopG family [Candidatus Bathyarchaeota archaeon]